jgi:hypothetical protein
MKQYRGFTDSKGVAWKVYRVEPQSVSKSLARLRQRLPDAEDERRRPWLLFESSAGEHRRLTPVPDGWNGDCTDADLAQWVGLAIPIPPAPARRADEDPHQTS